MSQAVDTLVPTRALPGRATRPESQSRDQTYRVSPESVAIRAVNRFDPGLRIPACQVLRGSDDFKFSRTPSPFKNVAPIGRMYHRGRRSVRPS